MHKLRIYFALIVIAALSALAVSTIGTYSAASSFTATKAADSRSQSGASVTTEQIESLGAGSPGGFLYVISDRTSGNQIFGYEVNETTGALSALAGFPIATGGNGEGATASELIAIDQVNRRLYAINDGSNTLSAFSINPTTGALSALPFSPITLGSGFWLTVAVHPSGSPVIVGDGGSTPSVMSFHVTATTAVAAPGSPYVPGTSEPFSSKFSVNGNYFYTGGNDGNLFAGYSVNPATGALTALPGSPFNSGGTFPLGFATDSQGRLFSINGSSQLRAFTTSNGVPAGVAGNPFQSGLDDGIDGVLSPNGNFFYAADRGQNRLGVFQIAGTGNSTTMAALAGTPLASGGQFTNALAFNKSGAFLYATNGMSRNITTFNVNAATGAAAVSSVQNANTLGVSGTLSGIVYFEQATVTPTPTPTPTPAGCSTIVTNVNDSGAGSLRSAVDCANATQGLDLVSFAIPGSGVRTITLASRIIVTDPVIIDGTTQGVSSTPLIELSGGNVTTDALRVTAGGSTLKGLAINRFTGTAVDFFTGGGNTIQGNFIGTNAAGTMALPNTFHGLRVNSANNLIGGPGPGMGNVLSGNGWDGLQLSNASLNNTIQGNMIGVGVDGITPIGNSDDGIEAAGSNNLIGGPNPGEGNIIANNGDRGIVLFGNTTFIGNRFSGNSIYSNGQLGIDLAVGAGGLGVTPNDPGDTDTGPNNLQNFPTFTSAETGASATTVSGSINSASNTTFRIELFSNDSCDPSGNGEGQSFYRAFDATTAANGTGTFNSSSGTLIPVGKFITATATDPSGNTSEFSQCIQVTAAPGIQISGRVTTPGGQGLRNAVVRMTLADGCVRVATTSSFGLYSFEDVPSGTSFVLGIFSKRYRFAPRSMQVFASQSDVDFVGLE